MKHPAVVIVRKVKRLSHTPHHGGSWKVAYADFVTAMMAFFLVMWIGAQSQAVRAAIGGYFRDPGVFDFERSTGMVPGGGESAYNPEGSARPRRPITEEEATATLERMAGRLQSVLESLPDFKALGKQIEIHVTAEGLRIELLERADATFFDSGSAHLKPETERILAAIARELGNLPNDIVLEGHTDSLPFARRGDYTNWELSADRANAARRTMERGGLRDGQVRGVRGFADTRLRLAQEPANPRNRRVSIVVATKAGAAAEPTSASTGGAGAGDVAAAQR